MTGPNGRLRTVNIHAEPLAYIVYTSLRVPSHSHLQNTSPPPTPPPTLLSERYYSREAETSDPAHISTTDSSAHIVRSSATACISYTYTAGL